MFKDYYSILGVAFQASDEEIRRAYSAKVESLGPESSKASNENYHLRVDAEVAYRVLCASYSLKTAYDEEYQNYIASDDKDNYEIQDDWTLSQIKSEIDFVTSRVLVSNPIVGEGVEKEGIGSKVWGCFLKVLGIFILLLVIASAKTCARRQARATFADSYTESNYNQNSGSATSTQYNSNAESKLQKTAREINRDLPRRLDNNITHKAISLTATALVYEYLVDDNYFSLIRGQALSSSNQLANVRAVYSDMKPMIDLLVQTHRGISYKYVCKNSHETNIVDVPYEDLAGL